MEVDNILTPVGGFWNASESVNPYPLSSPLFDLLYFEGGLGHFRNVISRLRMFMQILMLIVYSTNIRIKDNTAKCR